MPGAPGRWPRTTASRRWCRRNRPERREALLAPYRRRGLFESFPFGTDLSREEVRLGKASAALKEQRLRRLPRPHALGKALGISESARPYLQRMQLDAPRTPRERWLHRIVVYALAAADVV